MIGEPSDEKTNVSTEKLDRPMSCTQDLIYLANPYLTLNSV